MAISTDTSMANESQKLLVLSVYAFPEQSTLPTIKGLRIGRSDHLHTALRATRRLSRALLDPEPIR
jgi:hypothetical protein